MLLSRFSIVLHWRVASNGHKKPSPRQRQLSTGVVVTGAAAWHTVRKTIILIYPLEKTLEKVPPPSPLLFYIQKYFELEVFCYFYSAGHTITQSVTMQCGNWSDYLFVKSCFIMNSQIFLPFNGLQCFNFRSVHSVLLYC